MTPCLLTSPARRALSSLRQRAPLIRAEVAALCVHAEASGEPELRALVETCEAALARLHDEANRMLVEDESAQEEQNGRSE